WQRAIDINMVPNWPRELDAAACTHGMPLRSALGATPEQSSIKEVAVQIRIVSINTDSIWTRPCLTGWDTAALAAAFGAEPTPASLENSPRLMPCMIQDPANPPKIARKSKAFEKMSENI